MSRSKPRILPGGSAWNPRFTSLSMERGSWSGVRIRFSGIEHPANLHVKLYIYIYISGEDNPVLSTLDSQRLYRLLEDLLFRLTSFSLLLPSLASLSHRRTRCSNYYRHFRCPENCNSTVLQFSRGETIVEREG